MRIYFVSSMAAGLKIDGVYAGIIDGFEKFFDIGEDFNLLCEIIPCEGFKPLHFFLNDGFLSKPPTFADVYLSGGDALISFTRYKSADDGIKVVAQARYCSNLATLILNGGAPCLIIEADGAEHHELPAEFAAATLVEGKINDFPVLFAVGEGCLAVFSESGKQVFLNPAESYTAGEKLEITTPYPTCAGIVARCTFSYDGREMKLEKSIAEETQKPDLSCLHFAFFESVLHFADCAKYLCEELRPRARELHEFLGDFTEVTIPPEKFMLSHPEIRPPERYAAGLVYPLAPNLFEVKYFAADMKDGLIENLREIE